MSEEEQERDILDTKIRDDFGPELYKVSKALSVVLGYGSFGDYVSQCVRRDVNMFIQRGDAIDPYFEEAYRHLIVYPERGKRGGEQKREEVIPR
jgi:hypothetical protein